MVKTRVERLGLPKDIKLKKDKLVIIVGSKGKQKRYKI